MKLKFAVIWIALLLILTLSACESKEPAVSVQLTESGAPRYTVVRSDLPAAGIVSLTTDAVKQIRDESGFTFTIGTDWLARDASPDSEAYEILVGVTNRPETEAIAKTLSHGGYRVAVEGNKIIIYGSTLAAQETAMNEFIKALDKNEAGELMLNIPAGGIKNEGAPIFFDQNNAADYVIVASEDNDDAAKELADAIYQQYDIQLSIVRPGESSSELAILLGDCGDTTASVMESLTSIMEYRVVCEGKKLIIAGGCPYAVNEAVKYFVSTYVNNECSLSLQLPADTDYRYTGVTGAEHVERTEGSNLRIMSFNILAELWSDDPIKGRDDIVTATILTYMPDVAGLQEVSANWYKALDPRIGEVYEFVNRYTAEGKVNYSGIIYNPKTVKLIKSGCELFSQGNSGNMRLMNWGLFEKIDSGERFIVMNTHWDINNKTGEPNAYRLVQSGEMGNRVVELKDEYDCPIIVTGDYNANRTTEEFKNYIAISGTKDAQIDADVRVNTEYIGHHAVGKQSSIKEGTIDHITYTPDVTALFYKNLISAPSCNASDHNPIFADFALGK